MSVSGADQREVASRQTGPRAIAIAIDSVFWANINAIYRTARSGSEVATVLATGVDIRSIVFVDNRVCWTDRASGEIACAAEAGGDRTVLASGLIAPDLLVVSGAKLVWSDQGKAGDGGLTAAIRRIGLQGGAMETLASAEGAPSALLGNDTEVEWVDEGGLRAFKDGAQVTQVASGLSTTVSAQATKSYVYALQSNGTVVEVAKATGEQRTISTGEGTPRSSAIANSRLYWCDEGTGTIRDTEVHE